MEKESNVWDVENVLNLTNVKEYIAEGFLKYFRRAHNCNPAKTSEQAKKSMSIVMNRWVFAGSHLEEISSFCGCKEKRAGMYTTGMFSICCYWEWDLSTGKWDPGNKIWAGNWGWSSPSGPSFKPTFVNWTFFSSPRNATLYPCFLEKMRKMCIFYTYRWRSNEKAKRNDFILFKMQIFISPIRTRRRIDLIINKTILDRKSGCS